MRLGGKHIFKKEGDGDFYLNATVKEYWEAKLETCDQKSAEKGTLPQFVIKYQLTKSLRLLKIKIKK